MKFKRAISITAAVMLAVSANVSAAEFTDIWGHWAEKVILKLSDEGVINGITPERFEPEGTVTRAEFLKMTMEANNIETVDFRAGECLDAGKNDWFSEYLQSALDKGLIPAEMIGGYSVRVVSDTDADGNIQSRALYNGAFGGNAAINREEMAVITQNAYQYSLNASTMRDMTEPEENEFTDSENISVWAIPSIKLACAQGFIEGMDDGSFAPKATATRAQAAAIISRVMDKISR